MGWQMLRNSLRRWDCTGPPTRELEDALEEVLSVGNDSEALRLFSDALNPSLERGTDFLQGLAHSSGAKCRCDAVWYGDTIAYGCKTCGLSSASCICVFCFDAGDHEGHDFYISRSDYGCCDCGDVYAWRNSGFCRHHPGPRRGVDPTELLPEATRRRAQVLVPAQVRRLVRFRPRHFPQVTQPVASSGCASASSSVKRSITNVDVNAVVDGPLQGYEGDRVTLGSAATAGTLLAETPAQEPQHVLVTGVNLRVTEDQLRDFIRERCVSAVALAAEAQLVVATATPAANAPSTQGMTSPDVAVDDGLLSVVLVRDSETKASRGRAHVTLRDQASLEVMLSIAGETLRGSPLCVHAGAEAIKSAERHLQAWEANYEWLLSLGGFHDGLRKIIGDVFLDDALLGYQHKSAVEVLLGQSHLMEPSVRKLETNLMVDLMLDIDFKHRFAQIFTKLYRELVLARAGNQDTNELGDFTCQIFTRQDVTLELVRDHDLVRNLLACFWDLLRPALLANATPPVFNHESNIFRDHEIIQCSMDLLYVLDHSEVAREVICTPSLRVELWEGWVRVLIAMQSMNPHMRRTTTHIEYTSASWANALTLHTDLMSNTWLILDAIESKADFSAVLELASWAWSELRTWLLRQDAAPGRDEISQPGGSFDFEVSKAAVSFHAPVNRVLALLLHHLCVRIGSPSLTGIYRTDNATHGLELKGVRAVFSAVGLTTDADILWWMEHPLRALVLHSQVSAGMWRRNGEGPENESEFYRMNYWHHLLMDMDLLVLRLCALVVPPESFFQTLLARFELGGWITGGDPLSWLGGCPPSDDEFALQKLQGFVLFVYHLLSPRTLLSLSFPEVVLHNTRQYLSIGPRSHSQLWDPRLERSTATATAKDQQMLENALREISTFSKADGTGHSSAKYSLKEDQWALVDPYFHLFSWSEQQKSEENVLQALRSRGEGMASWISASSRMRPPHLLPYASAYRQFCSSRPLQAICWIVLTKLAFKYLQNVTSTPDGRLLVLTLHLALRSVHAVSAGQGVENSSNDEVVEIDDSIVPLGNPQDARKRVFTVAGAMGLTLQASARRRFRVRTTEFFDTRMCAECLNVPSETEICLLDAVEQLCAAPEESVQGGLARALRNELLQHPRNQDVVTYRERPWYVSAFPSNMAATGGRRPDVDHLEGVNNCAIFGLGGTQSGADETSPSVGARRGSVGASRDTTEMHDEAEARRAKRRKAAQLRQQRMLDDLKKRQAAFISGAPGQGMLEESNLTQSNGERNTDGTVYAPDCVVCMSRQDDEDRDNPLGLLCFLRPAPASCLPRSRVPTEDAVLLQVQKTPGVVGSMYTREPPCFSKQAPDGLVLARSCSHQMHFFCWRRFRASSATNSGGRLTCPYCGTVANALLPASSRLAEPSLLLSLESSGQTWAEMVPVVPDVTQNYASVLACETIERGMGGDNVAATAFMSAAVSYVNDRPHAHAEASDDFVTQLSFHSKKLGHHGRCVPLVVAELLGLHVDSPFLCLAKLCADNLNLLEVGLRARPLLSSASGSQNSSPGAGTLRYGEGAMGYNVLKFCVSEALWVAPARLPLIAAELALTPSSRRKIADVTSALGPHERFQLLTALLLCLSAGHPQAERRQQLEQELEDDPPEEQHQQQQVQSRTQKSSSTCSGAVVNKKCAKSSGRLDENVMALAAHSIIHGFYLEEVSLVLGALASDEYLGLEVAEAEANAASGIADSRGFAFDFWRYISACAALAPPSGCGDDCGGPPGTKLTPVRTRQAALGVLRLGLNPFLLKMHFLLALLCPGYVLPTPQDASSSSSDFGGSWISPEEQHRVLCRPCVGLHAVEDLLFPHSVAIDGALASSTSVSRFLVQCLFCDPRAYCCRGLQPPSPLLLVSVTDGVPCAWHDQPPHVWQVGIDGLERLLAANCQELVELYVDESVGSRLVCLGYRFSLPVVTGRIYQKFYTQFVHARCTSCKTSPTIPTLCLLCGTFLCCNSECCRVRECGEESAKILGEVTVHAQTCGFGTCVFLQLSNSLVHVVSDGFIASWGSLHLDEHGEEEYNLARPLHISEARLQQLSQCIREASLDFESRLKWKKVIFV